MRRLVLSSAAALALSLSAITPLAAEGLKEYGDCLAFVTRWCEITQAESRWWERLAVDVQCLGLYSNCSIELAR